MAKRNDRAFWQRIAGIYGAFMKRSSAATYEAICQRIRPELREDMCVLELACGSGQLSYPLAGGVRLWEASDASEKMIAAASSWPHSERLRFTVQDAENLPYEHATFDAAVISNALHILPHPERALREIRRVLRPGGLLFAPTYVHGGERDFRPRIWLMEAAGFHIYHKWTGAELMDVICTNGFAVQESVLLPDAIAPVCYVKAVKTA